MIKRVFALLCTTIGIFLLFNLTFAVSAAINDANGIGYNDFHNGIVDGSKYNTATVTKDTSSDIPYTKVVPNPQGSPDRAVSLDHYTILKHNINSSTLKYISIYCKYEGTKTLGKARINLMPHSGKYYTGTVTVNSNEEIKNGQWQWINFDVGSAAYGKVTGTYLFQFHLSPYGPIKSGELSSDDVMKIGKIRFIDYKNASIITGNYPISFTGARLDVVGTDPETIYADVGSSITLPANPYTRENHTFAGWICSADNQVYQPGDTYTVKERERKAGSLLYNVTGEAVFFPDWKITEEPAKALPDVFSVEYTDYYLAMLGDKDYFSAVKNYNFMGRNTVKLEILPSSDDALLADGWQWNNMPFDLDKYKYCTITYYVDTDKTFETSYPAFINMTSGGAVTKPVTVYSEYPFATGKWAVMGFDLTKLEPYFSTDLDSHILKQFHLYITGHENNNSDRIKASDFNAGDAVYLDTLTLYTEKPEGDLHVQQCIMSGDGNGNIRPHDMLTRAEAATIILNVLGNEGKITKMPENIEMTFSDVAPTDWFYNVVMAMDSLGYVPEDGLFRPYDPITVAEFLRLMAYIDNDGLHAPSFTGDAGNTNPITRAQAAMILSDRLTNGVPQQLMDPHVKIFKDLDMFSPEYTAFMNIGASRLSAFDEEGNERIYQMLCPGSYFHSLEYNFGETEEYLKELDKLEAERINEIRNTASVYKARHKDNKIYYVSSTEGTADGGTSAETPRLVSTLAEVSKLGAVNGDIVLFKRGDVFRGILSTVAGVTYSAYGEGEKPKLYRSEKNHTGAENWTVHYQDTETGKTIWKTTYAVSQDVGAIICNEGEVVALKEIPSHIDGVYYVRGREKTTYNNDGSVKVEQKRFVLEDELDMDLEFFHDVNGNSTGAGVVYFRYDKGNPGELFHSIEMNQKTNLISAKSNVTIDNLCLKYFGSHGIGAGTVSNLTVTNCEIGWGGGSIQHYNKGNDTEEDRKKENYGRVTRFGNGVEIYGGLVGFTIDNCYVYEIYDAGITHQISTTSPGNYYMKDVVYSNNVLCDSTYNIEYFMSIDKESTTNERFMENVLFENNLIRRAGYGWGQQRPDDAPAGIKGWEHHNNAVNTIIRNNIIDRCYNHVGGTSHLIQMGSTYNAAGPFLVNNTFVQVPDRYFAYTHKTNYRYGYNTMTDIESHIGGNGNKLYYANEDNGMRSSIRITG